MPQERKIPLEEARTIAARFLEAVAPFCERAEVAGSVRREALLVGDIEVVIQPKIRQVPGLFGPMEEDALAGFPWERWGQVVKDGPRYKRLLTPRLLTSQGVGLDVFIVRPPAQWGVIYLIRTGPAAFSRWAVTPRRSGGGLPSHLRVHDGAVWDGESLIPMPTEADFFDLLGTGYIHPREREEALSAIINNWRQS